MARLIPKIPTSEIRTKSERDVARELIVQLSDDCVVYHSYPWLREDRNDRGKVSLREGEADFVVVMPDIGLLVLEVKGGGVEYDPETRGWKSRSGDGREHEIKDPFEQARKNTHQLKSQILKQSFPGLEKLPWAFGYAVVFPDCVYSGPVPPGAENSIVLSAEDLPHLRRRLPEVLRKWNPDRACRPLSKSELDGVVKGLSPAFKLLPVLFRKIEEQEERLFRLTEEQMGLLDFLQNHKRAAVEGVAGSGKTILAMAQAQRFADQGLKTLMLCYNRALADWLRAGLPDTYQEKIFVATFHALCWKFCKDAGVKIDYRPDLQQEFWRDEAPNLFVEAIANCPIRYDAIVVDEGQDFSPLWWIPIEEMGSGKEIPFYVFYDPAQNLFVKDGFTTPVSAPPYRLPTNCRNTQKIANICGRVREIEIPVKDNAPVGDDTIVKVAETPEKQARLCLELIKDWCGRGRLKPSQISIQSPRSRKNSSLADIENLNGIPIVEDLKKWKANEGILFKTIRSFKGLESDAAIIIDVPKPDELTIFSRADFYVACSRAKHLLAILTAEENVF